MPWNARMADPIDVVDVHSLRSGYTGTEERERMARLRLKLEVVRNSWLKTEAYQQLVSAVRDCLDRDKLPPDVRDTVERLLSGFRDYADVDAQRPQEEAASGDPGQFDALELYCSVKGFDHVFKPLVGNVVRSEKAAEQDFVAAVTLVEFLTMDLYNLRLSQLGDPRYENFQGVTHRGMSVKPATVDFYAGLLARPDLAERAFAIPLALTSTSAESDIGKSFTKPKEAGMIHLDLEIHVRGIDPQLLAAYRRRHPDSVVTSTCAMPVAHVSPEPEKEVLLRGAFFQLLALHRTQREGVPCVTLVVLTMNANRDHTTELSSNANEKKVQRNLFKQLVDASKYLACAALAEDLAPGDAAGYEALAAKAMAEIRMIEDLVADDDADLEEAAVSRARTTPDDVAVWHGGRLATAHPRCYALQRQKWHRALDSEDWISLLKILDSEYEWRRADWYNVPGLMFPAESVSSNHDRTLLHVLAVSPAPSPDKSEQMVLAWRSILEGVSKRGVWKTLRSFDRAAKTANRDARDRAAQDDIQAALEPRILHQLVEEDIVDLDDQLHDLMTEVAGKLVSPENFSFPQLSVLMEMETPKLWVPVAWMNGGFFFELDPSETPLTMYVTVIKTVVGEVLPQRTTYLLRPGVCRETYEPDIPLSVQQRDQAQRRHHGSQVFQDQGRPGSAARGRPAGGA